MSDSSICASLPFFASSSWHAATGRKRPIRCATRFKGRRYVDRGNHGQRGFGGIDPPRGSPRGQGGWRHRLSGGEHDEGAAAARPQWSRCSRFPGPQFHRRTGRRRPAGIQMAAMAARAGPQLRVRDGGWQNATRDLEGKGDGLGGHRGSCRQIQGAARGIRPQRAVPARCLGIASGTRRKRRSSSNASRRGPAANDRRTSRPRN